MQWHQHSHYCICGEVLAAGGFLGQAPASAMGQLQSVPAISLAQVSADPCRQIRPGKGSWIWWAAPLLDLPPDQIHPFPPYLLPIYLTQSHSTPPPCPSSALFHPLSQAYLLWGRASWYPQVHTGRLQPSHQHTGSLPCRKALYHCFAAACASRTYIQLAFIFDRIEPQVFFC